jgi:cyclohexyl-isocyanide hydratase
MALTCGMVMFPGMTQLDLTGPYEVLCRVPGVKVVLLAAEMEPLRSEHGMAFVPEATFATSPALDILFVGGGTSIDNTLNDARYVDFVRSRGQESQWVVSVCTGALLLGAAGLLKGYRATTHWASIQFLEAFGAVPMAGSRVVVDRNRMTGGGVTAGVDLGLALAAHIAGEEVAKRIQLSMEYDPHPPFHCGHPREAQQAMVDGMLSKMKPMLESRRAAVMRAARGIS